MIYLTGDIHGQPSRLGNRNFPAARNLARDDVVIILGDFGVVWNKDRNQEYWLDWLENRPFTTCFLDGNHENFDLLEAYPVAEWKSGNVHVVRDHVLHLMRGQVFDIQGRTVLTMGGAASHDVDDGILDPADPDFKAIYAAKRFLGQRFRVLGRSWWPREMPSEDEYTECMRNAAKRLGDIDIVLSHEGPANMVKKLGDFVPDELSTFLQKLDDEIQPAHWYFGHYHMDRAIDPRHTVLYHKIMPLN